MNMMNSNKKLMLTSCSAAFLSFEEALERSTFFMTYYNEQANKPTERCQKYGHQNIKAKEIRAHYQITPFNFTCRDE